MTDFIGDIHGHADKLEVLLTKLGYAIKNGSYYHSERKVLFVGDYIDRGPKIRETLQLVKAMVDSGNAIALMGNHEYNAICFHFPETEGGHLRKHLIKNVVQHVKTLEQFQNMQSEYEMYLDWFKTLPVFYETDEFRAVHACWDQTNINYLKTILPDARLTDELIYKSAKKGTDLYNAVDETLKGKEIPLPAGKKFTDKDGTDRTKIRIRWWEDPTKGTYESLTVKPIEELPDTPIENIRHTTYYDRNQKPVFFGHYWLEGQPSLFQNNICCLDYSVAKDGLLVAYSFDGERELKEEKLVSV